MSFHRLNQIQGLIRFIDLRDATEFRTSPGGRYVPDVGPYSYKANAVLGRASRLAWLEGKIARLSKRLFGHPLAFDCGRSVGRGEKSLRALCEVHAAENPYGAWAAFSENYNNEDAWRRRYTRLVGAQLGRVVNLLSDFGFGPAHVDYRWQGSSPMLVADSGPGDASLRLGWRAFCDYDALRVFMGIKRDIDRECGFLDELREVRDWVRSALCRHGVGRNPRDRVAAIAEDYADHNRHVPPRVDTGDFESLRAICSSDWASLWEPYAVCAMDPHAPFKIYKLVMSSLWTQFPEQAAAVIQSLPLDRRGCPSPSVARLARYGTETHLVVRDGRYAVVSPGQPPLARAREVWPGSEPAKDSPEPNHAGTQA